MGKNKANKGIQQGAIHKQPDQHGDKTRERQAEIAHSGNKHEIHEDRGPGHHRLFEDREQHDEADKNSEKTRIARDLERHKHEKG